MENEKRSVFETLNEVNVNEHTETKGNAQLKYLSWAWAWAEVKKRYPNATYTIYETTNPNGYVCNYFTDGRTCWVKTGVTIEGIEHIEELPVMDYNNKSILLSNVSSFDVNKAIQRSLTKAVARHGLGLYIYAGEDLPDANDLKGTTAITKETPKAPIENKVEQIIKQDVEMITPLQIDEMDALGVNIANVCHNYKVDDISKLTKSEAEIVLGIKRKQLQNQQ